MWRFLLSIVVLSISPVAPALSQHDPPAPQVPRPHDLIVEETDKFRLEYEFLLADAVDRDAAREILTEAAEFVESKFPNLKCFGKINAERAIKIRIYEKVWSNGKEVLGSCSWSYGAVVICFTPESIQDGETAVHEWAHVMLVANNLKPLPWIDEGIARYLEYRDGTCPAARTELARLGTFTKAELKALKSSTLHSGACGWIVVKYLHEERGFDLEMIAVMKEQDLPEPIDAFLAHINWDKSRNDKCKKDKCKKDESKEDESKEDESKEDESKEDEGKD